MIVSLPPEPVTYAIPPETANAAVVATKILCDVS